MKLVDIRKNVQTQQNDGPALSSPAKMEAWLILAENS